MSGTYRIKKIIILLGLGLLAAPSLMASPWLQLYIEGASYDYGTRTWVTQESDFKLWVVASHLSTRTSGTLYDIGIVAALSNGDDPNSGSLSITPSVPTAGPGTTYAGSDFVFGTPLPSNPMPSHGVYPADYVTHHVADNSPMDPDEWFEMGSYWGHTNYAYAWAFDVSTTYSQVHFDAFGNYNSVWCGEKSIYASTCRDAEYVGEVVPEPATLLLMGFGLMGAGIYRRFKK